MTFHHVPPAFAVRCGLDPSKVPAGDLGEGSGGEMQTQRPETSSQRPFFWFTIPAPKNMSFKFVWAFGFAMWIELWFSRCRFPGDACAFARTQTELLEAASWVVLFWHILADDVLLMTICSMCFGLYKCGLQKAIFRGRFCSSRVWMTKFGEAWQATSSRFLSR